MKIEDQHKLMTDMRLAMAEAMYKVAEPHGPGKVHDACFLGATGWLFCELLDAGGHEVDDKIINSLRKTLELVRMKLDVAPTDSVH
jgi:hypothetical protein